MMTQPGFVYLVGAGPGDPKLLTLRALELMHSAQVVAYDELVSPEILSLIPPQAELLAVGRRHGHGKTGYRLHPMILERARAGRNVVRLKSGDPLIFGRGAEEAEELVDAGIPFEIVPGVSAALGAAAYAGIPLTDRRYASRVTFATGHCAEADRGRARETVVLYMAAHRLKENLDRLIAEGHAPSTPAACVAAATTPKQIVISGTLADLADRIDPARWPDPALVIVGEVVALRDRIRWFEKIPLRGRRILVARAPNLTGPDGEAERHASLMLDRVEIPRLIVAGSASGVGKTTFTVGLVRALRSRGLKVAVFKCGPDYLDPTYHARAAGTTPHNLDGWMMGREAVHGTFLRASAGADIAIIEGVMGLFDGASPREDDGSTAEIAKWLDAPVLLVVDASGMARSIGAVGCGFADFDREVRLAGLICNRLGSKTHLKLLRDASDRLPVLGGLPKNESASFPQRHLGLRSADERSVPDALLSTWGELVGDWCELDAIIALAGKSGALAAEPMAPPRQRESKCTIGIAFDEAFHFYYEDNLTRLENAGARLIRFSPIHDTELPAVDGLYLGGGYPEAHAAQLAANASMRRRIAAFAAAGGVIYAECGGLMYLCSELRTLDGCVYPMCGVVTARTEMCERLQALGYVEAQTRRDSILGAAGLQFRGHQFRYSRIEMLANEIQPAFTIRRRRDGNALEEGIQTRNTIASYVHAHWASNPAVAHALVEACARAAAGKKFCT